MRLSLSMINEAVKDVVYCFTVYAKNDKLLQFEMMFHVLGFIVSE